MNRVIEKDMFLEKSFINIHKNINETYKKESQPNS